MSDTGYYVANEIENIVLKYYEKRGLEWPTTEEALMWSIAELGETFDLVLSRNTKWVRNNPEKHPQFSKEKFSEELGDIIMMLFVAGICEYDVNPLNALLDKINRKLLEQEV
jgi:NTP pyrophosphatase (non-canonical NTP hydrolase)